MPSIAVKRRQLHHPEARPTIGDFAVGRLARKLAMEGPPISVDRYRCEAESAPIPATIRNSTLLLPAIPKMLPCSIRACPKILPAPWIGRSHYNMLKSFENSASEDRLSLQFLKISLQIGKLQGDGPRDRFASDCILSHAVQGTIHLSFSDSYLCDARLPISDVCNKWGAPGQSGLSEPRSRGKSVRCRFWKTEMRQRALAPCSAQCASGSGRSWNFTSFGSVPLPPSTWNGVRLPADA